MEETALQTNIRKILAIENDSERSWAFAKAMVALDLVSELEEARLFVQADERLFSLLGKSSLEGIKLEIELRTSLAHEFTQVDREIQGYPTICELRPTTALKVALLHFSLFASCDVSLTCRLLEEILKKFKSGADKYETNCGFYAEGQWPRNHRPSVLSAIATFSQRPCWVLRHMFLPNLARSGLNGNGVVYFNIKPTQA